MSSRSNVLVEPERKCPPAPSTTIWYSRLIRTQLVSIVWERTENPGVVNLLRPHWDRSFKPNSPSNQKINLENPPTNINSRPNGKEGFSKTPRLVSSSCAVPAGSSVSRSLIIKIFCVQLVDSRSISNYAEGDNSIWCYQGRMECHWRSKGKRHAIRYIGLQIGDPRWNSAR